MKKLNLSIALKNLKGEELKDKDSNNAAVKACEIIANSLSASKPANPQRDVIKQYKLALKVYDTKGEEEYEDDEVAMMIEVVKRNELQYTTLIAGQLLTVLGQ